MTSAAGSTFAHDTSASAVYDPDEPLFSNGSPPMTAHRPKLLPSPSPPPAVPLPKVPPSQGDAVLIHYLGGGKQPDIAARAGQEPLSGFVEDDGIEDDDEEDEDEDEEGDSYTSSRSGYTGSPKMTPDPPATSAAIDLKSLAAEAVASLNLQPPSVDELSNTQEKRDDMEIEEIRCPETSETDQQQPQLQSQPPPPPQPPPHHPQLQPLQPRNPAPAPGLAMPITPYTPHGPPSDFSPRFPTAPASGLRHPDVLSPGLPTPNSHGELPPIMQSPKSETNGPSPPMSLPSIRAQLGDQLSPNEQQFSDQEINWRRPSFPHSPPGANRLPMLPNSPPPISPNYGNSMPSPAHSMFSPHSNGYYPYSAGSRTGPGHEYSSAASSHAETPNTDPNSTPGTSITDRMSIDNMTNPQQGTFICKFTGCTAAPFQTQYLLNSHANVHSSARPHYCPVKGCPRSEGGKGFKRKNEMIRHGLVHESPGYVCPFCPDREHKYPRPDNLQRHVRVHHADKDKDDAALRDVLAQRPDGPNRGRRRRGVP